MLAIIRDVRMSFNARVANFGIFVNSLRLNHHVFYHKPIFSLLCLFFSLSVCFHSNHFDQSILNIDFDIRKDSLVDRQKRTIR